MKQALYLIGLDVIFHEDQVSILEIQQINDCTQNEITIKSSLNLIQVIQKNYPDLKIVHQPGAGNPDDYARKASLHPTSGMINVGIESFSVAKWLFYSFCGLHSELNHYIPKTTVLTLDSLKALPIEELKTTPLFKPADQSRGKGVRLFTADETKNFQNLNHSLNSCFIVNSPLSPFRRHYPFILQKFLGHNLVVTRVFALVIVDMISKKIQISIDGKNSFRETLIEEKKYDCFELANKNFQSQALSAIEKQPLKKFLRAFFHRLLDFYSMTEYRYWEILAKQYINSYDILTQAQRQLLLSKLSLAFSQQQRFTQNKLSFYQCLILEGFIKCFLANNDAKIFRNSLNAFLINGIGILCKCNFDRYADHKNYRLTEGVRAFAELCLSDPGNQNLLKAGKSILEQLNPPGIPVITPIQITSSEKRRDFNRFFDMLTKKDIDNLILVSKTSLNSVAAGCGLTY